MFYFDSGKKHKKLMILKIIISTLIILFLVFSLTSCCAVASKMIKAALAVSSGSSSSNNKASGESGNPDEQTQSSEQAGIGENSEIEDSKEVSESTESVSPEASENGGLRLVYTEITSDSKSNHFEHRVENIYSVATDGSFKELIFSDIKEDYDLGPVFSISPDGKKIACKFVEGARGLYSALAVIDISSKSITLLEEFDYIGHEEDVNVLDLYEIPYGQATAGF